MLRRRAGIILHPTSLPGDWRFGDLGGEAYRFVEFLAEAGQTVWQVLPLGPTHGDLSPYQALSTHAGNPLMISTQWLVDKGWLSAGERDEALGDSENSADHVQQSLLASAWRGFQELAPAADREALQGFVRDHDYWLEDFALYRALRQESGQLPWTRWPRELRDREPDALADAGVRLSEALDEVRFEQFVFFQQWMALKYHANRHGVLIFGDMPIFVSHDSADVWANRDYFRLDEEGEPEVVAGVPPDYFSATGQRWGNPHYDWARIQADGFRWWIDRMRTQLTLFDMVRVDHFRGFEAYWEIPAEEETAIGGRWVKAPGEAFLSALQNHFGKSLPLVAEDLGEITPEVFELRDRFGLPGMKILQFAFDSDAENPYLPHNHESNSVVYTGTHDNNTTLGWFGEVEDYVKERLHEYLGYPSEAMPWPIIRAALASRSRLAVLPLQDPLELGADQRMNIPGTQEDNWRWRFHWDMVDDGVAERLRQLSELYGRT